MSNTSSLPPLVAVVGPTAAGKTALARHIAEHHTGELISADSRQVYRGMDIGTAKDTTYPHHLVDILDPTETFSAAEYKEMAEKKIATMHRNKKLPILVGGTGLYIDAVVYNYQFPGAAADPELRKTLAQQPVEVLHERLEELDSQAAAVARKNKRRIIRALEVIEQTGEKFSEQKDTAPQKYDALLVGIRRTRKELYRRIADRLDSQLRQGLVQEVVGLISQYGADAFALQNTICYKELIPHIAGPVSLEEAKKEILKNNRRYARRQMVWFKRNKDIRWVQTLPEAEEHLTAFLAKRSGS